MKNPTINKPASKELVFYVAAFGLLIISFFHNLGLQPLYLEEPRRALIALEMIYNDNLWVPTEFGQFYYNKPPLWNWMIILAYKIFGSYSEFAVRFFSVLSFLGMGCITFLAGRKYVNLRFGLLASFLLLVSIDIYFYFSMTGEIDLFYSLLTYAALVSLHHFYQQKQFYRLFIIFYLLNALGALTKGFPSLAFTAISLLVFFLYKNDFKRLFSLPHIVGALIFLTILGSYVYAYSHYNNPVGFIETLWSEASNRTIGSKTIVDYLLHFIQFPLDFFKNILPASLLLIFVFQKGFMKKIRSNPLIEFSFILLIANVLLYWFSPGTRQRYVYMLYPLAINILTFFFLQSKEEKDKRHIALYYLCMGIIILSTLTFIAFPFVRNLQLPANKVLIATVGVILNCLILFVYIKRKKLAFQVFLLLFVLLRFVFNSTVLPYRATHGKAQKEKETALQIAEITQDEKVRMYGRTQVSRNSIFYLERETKAVVLKTKKIHENIFYIANLKLLDDKTYHEFYRFEFKGDPYVLIKFIE